MSDSLPAHATPTILVAEMTQALHARPMLPALSRLTPACTGKIVLVATNSRCLKAHHDVKLVGLPGELHARVVDDHLLRLNHRVLLCNCPELLHALSQSIVSVLM